MGSMRVTGREVAAPNASAIADTVSPSGSKTRRPWSRPTLLAREARSELFPIPVSPSTARCRPSDGSRIGPTTTPAEVRPIASRAAPSVRGRSSRPGAGQSGVGKRAANSSSETTNRRVPAFRIGLRRGKVRPFPPGVQELDPRASAARSRASSGTRSLTGTIATPSSQNTDRRAGASPYASDDRPDGGRSRARDVTSRTVGRGGPGKRIGSHQDGREGRQPRASTISWVPRGRVAKTPAARSSHETPSSRRHRGSGQDLRRRAQRTGAAARSRARGEDRAHWCEGNDGRRTRVVHRSAAGESTASSSPGSGPERRESSNWTPRL